MEYDKELSDFLYQEGHVHLRAAKELHPFHCKSGRIYISSKRMEEKMQKSEQILLEFYGYYRWKSLREVISGNAVRIEYSTKKLIFRAWGTENDYDYCIKIAIRGLNNAINTNPENMAALYAMAYVNELLGNYEYSLKHLDKLIKLKSDHSTGLFLKPSA